MPRLTIRIALFLLVPTVIGIGVAAIVGGLSWAHALAALIPASVTAIVLARFLSDQLDRLYRVVDGLADRGVAESDALSQMKISVDALDRIARAARREATAFRSRLSREADRLARLESVAHVLPEAVLLIDGSGRVLMANAIARQLFGRDAVGADLSGLIRDPAFQDALPAALSDRGTASVEFDIETPAERSIRALIRTVPAVAADDIAAVIVLQDITTLRRLDQMRVDFVANVSHELRTPLSSLMGFLETLRGPARDDPQAQARFLEIMQEQAERMLRIVEDLLSLSRIETDKSDLPAESVAVMPLIHQQVEMLQLRAMEKGLRFVVTPPPAAENIMVRADRDQLAQVLQNLMDNAIKYGGRDGTIDIRLSLATEPQPPEGTGHAMVRVDVADHGEGIAPEHVSRLTERFYRVDKARSRELGGTGLGLAIVKHIMNRHLGRLEIESQPGKGSTFSVFVPAA